MLMKKKEKVTKKDMIWVTTQKNKENKVKPWTHLRKNLKSRTKSFNNLLKKCKYKLMIIILKIKRVKVNYKTKSTDF